MNKINQLHLVAIPPYFIILVQSWKYNIVKTELIKPLQKWSKWS